MSLIGILLEHPRTVSMKLKVLFWDTPKLIINFTILIEGGIPNSLVK